MFAKHLLLIAVISQNLLLLIEASSLPSPTLPYNDHNKYHSTQTSYHFSHPIPSSLKHNVFSCRGGASKSQMSPPKTKNNRKAAITGLKNSLASALGAICSKTALAPFDTIKTIQQEHITTSTISSLSFYDAAQLVLKRGQGFLGFYAGLGVAAIGAMPSVGLYFGIYSYSKNIVGPYLQQNFGSGKSLTASIPTNDVESRDRLLRTLTIATSAAIGNTIASISRVPYEVVKQKLQMNQYPNTWVALTSMMTEGGKLTIRPFFPLGGISSQMARDIPYAIFTLLTYEYLRDNWVNKHNSIQPSSSKSKTSSKLASGWWRDMVAGAIAGGVGSYLTNPLDVIKTRLQTGATPYAGVWDCAQRTWIEEGPRAFLKGSAPRLMHKIPANAMFFVSYELFRRLLKADDGNNDEEDAKK